MDKKRMGRSNATNLVFVILIFVCLLLPGCVQKKFSGSTGAITQVPLPKNTAVGSAGGQASTDPVEEAIIALKTPATTIRNQAMETLGESGDPRAVEPLIAVLQQDKASTIRRRAAETLGKIKDPRVVEALISAMKDPDASVRQTVITTLRQIEDPRVFDVVVAALNDEGFTVRQVAIEWLGKAKDARAVEPLIEALEDSGPGLPDAAAVALGEIGDPRAIEPIIAALEEERLRGETVTEVLVGFGASAVEPLIAALPNGQFYVREVAINVLGEIGDARAIESLIAIFEEGDGTASYMAVQSLAKIGEPAVEPLISALNSDDPLIRQSAAQALGEIGDARAVQPLIAHLQDEDSDVHYQVNQAFVSIGEPAVQPLIALLDQDDPEVQQTAVDLLGRIKDPRAVERLIGALKGNNSMLQFAAQTALINIGEPAVEPLIPLLKEPDVAIRSKAVEALARIGGAGAVEGLIAALDDDSSFVRWYAASGLGNIEDARCAEIFDAAFREEDLELIAAGARYFIKKGQAGSEELLIKALKSNGHASTAEDFLNSGNGQLEQAARDWAVAHKYTIQEAQFQKDSPRWGSGQ